MSLHHSARSFDRVSEQYERGRPDYAREAVQQMLASLPLGSSPVIVDLGAGTGKLTRMLVGSGARLFAVEPLSGMRRVLETQVPQAEAIEGTAQAIPLPDGCCDAMAIASAFHWFAEPVALTEIRRVLKPAGGLALLWNRRDTTQAIQHTIGTIIQPYRRDVPSHADGVWRGVLEGTGWFEPIGVWHFPHKQEMDSIRLVDRVLSISFIAELPSDERAAVRGQIERAAADLTELFSLRYFTDLYCYRRAID